MNNIVKFKGAQLPAQGMTSAFLRAKDTVGVTGATPFLRLVKGTGEWVYGMTNTDVEENSLWAINPNSFQTGFIAWKGGRPVGKRMKPINDPNPVTFDELPDVGVDWDVNVAFELQCVHGEDAKLPVVVEYANNSHGAKKAFSALMSTMHRQSIEDPAHIVPVVELLSESYIHPEWGRTFNPIFEIRKWLSYDTGGAAQPEASPQEQEPAARKAPPSEPSRDAAASEAAPVRRRAAAAVTDVENLPDDVDQVSPEKSEPVTRRRRRAAAPA